MFGVSDAMEACQTARELLSGGHPALALAEIEPVTADPLSPRIAEHPIIAACLALKAEILLEGGTALGVHFPVMERALALCERHIDDDFEGVAPVMLNAVRYFLRQGMRENAEKIAANFRAACERLHGTTHPRYYQLMRWLDEALSGASSSEHDLSH